MSETTPLVSVRATNDPGDETANRYYYQYAYTAILACGMLATDGEILELFCEHHEDILLRRRDDKLHGIQVKTRQLGLDPWKSGDDAMIGSLLRFVGLENNYATQFWRYTIATNHQFFEARENGSNLPYLLKIARVCAPDGSDLANPLKAFVKKLVRASGCDCTIVLAVLRKTDCDHRLPKLDGIRRELCDHVRMCHPDCAEASYSQLYDLADRLVVLVEAAASLRHAQSMPLYMSLQADATRREDQAAIEGKRLTRQRIANEFQQQAVAGPLISPAFAGIPQPLPEGDSPLLQKLDAGGFSAMGVDSAMDCYVSAFKQQREWASKIGEGKALERYRHLSTVVKAEAAAAYDATESTTAPFGRTMLERLRARVIARRERGDVPLFGSADEQLLGYAFMLTDECKVWWSRPFAIRRTGGTNGTH